MKGFITFLLLFVMIVARSQELSVDVNTLLLLHFNNSVIGAAGETPLNSSNITYDVGRFGQALKCNGSTLVKFDTTGNLNRYSGTIEFWIKPENFSGAGYIFDYNYINGILLEIGYFTGIAISKNPDIGLSWPELAWFPNTWYHLAFTWGNGELKMFLNGRFITKKTYNQVLSAIPLNQFSVGGPSFGSGFKGLIDEFRISKVPRTDGEIGQDFLQGWGTIQSISNNQQSITLFKGWNVYLGIPHSYQTPSFVAKNGTDSILLGLNCFNWTVSDPTILQIDNSTLILKGIGGGTANLIGTISGFTVTISVTVKIPFLPEERVQVIDPFLTSPASCHSTLIPVSIIMYLPTDDGINLNTTYGGTNFTNIAKLKQHVINIAKFAKFSLEEGSKFRGYSNPNANPYLGYKIVEVIIEYEPPPLGFLKRPGVYLPDYNLIMNKHNGKKLVDTIGVREMWLFSGDWLIAEGNESNMSSPTTGDISNSDRRNDDLPVYENTYTLYHYSIQRGGNEAVHNHGHQLESMITYVATKQDGNPDLFWKNFVGRSGPNYTNPLGRCGDTHNPPNTIVDYDYCNSTLVASDIFDWKPEGGQTKLVNCQTWDTLHYAWPQITISGSGCCDAGELPDYNSRFFILWMQSMPGNGNQIPYANKWMTNWWRFIGNWDSTTAKIGLYQNSPEVNATCTATIGSSLGASPICAGGSLAVNFSVSGSTLNTGNIFTAQLSDANGSFSSPVNIGTFNSISISGTINVTIPLGTIGGSNYLIRTVSSNPTITGAASTTLTVKAIPAAPVITAGTATTFCTGASVTLTSNAASGNQWYKDGLAISGSTGTTLNTTASGSYTVKVNVNGCESSPSNSIAVIVNSIPSTPAIIAGSSTTFCSGGSVTLTSNAASGNQWYKDGVAINGSTATTLNVTTAGNYTVKVTVNGCVSAASNIIATTVNAIPPTPTISQNGFQLVSSATSGNQWVLNNAAVTGATGQNYTPVTVGNYTVQVTVNNCSSAFSTVINITITGIPNIDVFGNQVKIMPNPVANKLLIKRSGILLPLDISLFDITGKRLKQLNNNLSNTEVDMSKFAAGTYILWIEERRSKLSGKKVIIKL